MDWSKYPNFTEEEFKCKHTGKCYMQEEFMERLQKIRTIYGKPMIITSGYRDKTHPEEIKKLITGEHVLGVACDIKIYGKDCKRLLKILLNDDWPRVGISQNGDIKARFIHLGMGTGKQGFVQDWIYSY